MIKATLAKLLTLKAAGVLAIVSASGVAVAATTGILPNTVGSDSPAAVQSTPNANHSAGTPSPSLHGLCTAFLAGAGAERGKALDSPAFTVLVTAAGGKDEVATYCTALVTTAPGAKATDHPTGPPTGRQNDPSAGKSGDHPTGPATPRATNAPTAPPSHPGS